MKGMVESYLFGGYWSELRAPMMVLGYTSTIGDKLSDGSDFLWGGNYALNNSYVTPVLND